MSMALRGVNMFGYLWDGVTHDLFLPHRNLVPDTTALCVSPGEGGHLAWNHGFINAKYPFLPHYADLLLGLGVPALVEQPLNASLWGLLILASRVYTGGNQKESGSVWCV